jgi:hypothetical protein
MSWNRKEFKEAYHRENTKREGQEVADEQLNSPDYYEQFFDCCDACDNGSSPTMEDIRRGNLLWVLQKLGLRTVKEQLDQLWW